MKKIDWGKGITIVIILFLIITIGQVLAIHYFIDYDLVEEEYYEAEINYQDQIKKINRTKSLHEQVVVKLRGQALELTFPSGIDGERISGMVQYYKPSDDLQDKIQKIILNDENRMFIDTKELSTGYWKIKIDWSVNEVQYYSEESMMVP